MASRLSKIAIGMLPSTVIPAFPFEGAFYWFLGASTTRHSLDHPYYKVLYSGAQLDPTAAKTGLLCLFDDIVIAPADHGLPDYHSFISGDHYEHPDLSLSMSWGDNEWSPENTAAAEALLSRPQVKELMDSHPLFERDDRLQHHMLCRSILQIRLAAESNALLLGNGFFNALYTQIAPLVSQLLPSGLQPGMKPMSLSLEQSELDALALDFTPSDIDAFAAIRASDEISEYAESFRRALGRDDPQGADFNLIEIMKEAMEKEEISSRVVGGLKLSGRAASIAGFFPIIGTIASGFGLAADAGGEVAERRRETHRWYLLGSKMREVALKELLRRS